MWNKIISALNQALMNNYVIPCTLNFFLRFRVKFLINNSLKFNFVELYFVYKQLNIPASTIFQGPISRKNVFI